MTSDEIIKHILENYDGTILKESYGEKSLFYNPENKLSSGTYFLTIKEKDGPNDKASKLDRNGVFRVNVGASKETFLKLFNTVPKRPPKGGIIDTGHDFTQLDTIMPHPVYGWAYWICVLNPSAETFIQNFEPLIREYYEMTKKRFYRRLKKEISKFK